MPASIGIAPRARHGAATRWLAQQRALRSCLSPSVLVTLPLPRSAAAHGPLAPAVPSRHPALADLRCCLARPSPWTPHSLGGQGGHGGESYHTWTAGMASHPPGPFPRAGRGAGARTPRRGAPPPWRSGW